jgi:nucleotide-binding universal stress UspA family protein
MLEKILIATDGSRYSEKAADFAVEMATLSKGKITALYVIDIGKEYVGDITYNVADEVIEGMKNTLKKKGEAATRSVEEKAKGAGVPIESKIIEGDPATVILKESEGKMDHIVIGSIGVSGFGKFLMGSVADKVVRNSKIPVTVVPST